MLGYLPGWARASSVLGVEFETLFAASALIALQVCARWFVNGQRALAAGFVLDGGQHLAIGVEEIEGLPDGRCPAVS